ncbi:MULTISPECIES: hypothetical protein [Bacillus]|uniref:ORF24 n=2 Tax=root TaxID=1 RepID=Q9ZXF9_BPPH1|nr:MULTISPECIES: hypothetical protein [Bacillus]NP_690757.1 hypothetical protein phi105_04 [Bacillus phage phi105]YP_009829877.1 hypothetical protein HWA84_gp03 [Bacillus phage phi105]ADF59136.1 hypothetical protein PHI105_00015 [Bacillus phage phi105]ANB49566.1 hypothetical protein A1D33_019965 [Bacillus velezensis]AQP98118.1 hypothetical protein BZ167_19930 [Bacillus sp. 275]AVI28709.1 hypothetical protein C3Z10_10100 [Bacillus velezensis]AWX72361.1 hypothetical protein BVDSYZ_10120 [Bacil
MKKISVFFAALFNPRVFKKGFSFFLLILNDLLFMAGAAFILTAVYRWSTNIGLILTGVFLMFYAYLISKKAR